MADDESSPHVIGFPADDEADDVRWLATLIQALRAQVSVSDHPEVRAILDEAYGAAQAVAQGGGASKPH